MKGSFSAFILILIVATGCISNKLAFQKDNPNAGSKLVISYQHADTTNPKAPEYTVELYSNKQMFLYAKKNLDKSGKYMRSLSKAEYEQAVETFIKMDFFKFDAESCPSELEQPAKYLFFAYQGNEKKIKVCHDSPEGLKELEFSIQSFLDRVGWEKLTW